MNIIHRNVNTSPLLPIGYCNSGVSTKYPVIYPMSYVDACAIVKYEIPEGTKDGPYFTRAPLIEGANTRSNNTVQNLSSVIILDADSTVGEEEKRGAPCPYKVHENLKYKGINHLIYRSFSHQLDGYGNRYRIFIPTNKPYSIDELKDLNEYAIELCGEGLKNVPENSDWSHAWYLPRRPMK